MKYARLTESPTVVCSLLRRPLHNTTTTRTLLPTKQVQRAIQVKQQQWAVVSLQVQWELYYI